MNAIVSGIDPCVGGGLPPRLAAAGMPSAIGYRVLELLASFSSFSSMMPISFMASKISRNDWTMLPKITGFHSFFSFLLKPWA